MTFNTEMAPQGAFKAFVICCSQDAVRKQVRLVISINALRLLPTPQAFAHVFNAFCLQML